MKKYKKTQATFLSALNIAQDSIMSRMNCHNIGKIIKFYPETQTADIELMQVKQFADTYYNLPPLMGVPVVVYGAVNAYITLPQLEGATCILLFMDRNIDNFLLTKQNYVPNTNRMHNITDCIALTTFKTQVDPLTDYDNEAIMIRNYGTDENGQHFSYNRTCPNHVQIKSTNTVTKDEETTITTSNLDINANSVLLENSNGGQIEVNAKINIANTAQNLATLMQALLTACENIAVNKDTGVILPDSKQAFTDLKTQFEGLLQ